MASKNKKSIVAEQNKARKELLLIKAAQNNGVQEPVKREEVPLTGTQKAENFWYYNKKLIAIMLLIIAGIIFIIAECSSNPDYDFKVVVYTNNIISDGQAAKIGEYFSKYAKDINGDGEVLVDVLNLSIDKSQSDNEYEYNIQQKLVSELSTGDKSLLYITDADSIEVLNEMSDVAILDGEPYVFGEEFYKQTTYTEDGVTLTLPEGFQLSCRRLKGTVLEKYDTAQEVYTESQRILEEIKKAGD